MRRAVALILLSGLMAAGCGGQVPTETTALPASTTSAPGTTAGSTTSAPATTTTALVATTMAATLPPGPGIDMVGPDQYSDGSIVTFLEEGIGGQEFIGPSGVAFLLDEGTEIRAWSDGKLVGVRQEEWSTGYGVLRPHQVLILQAAAPEQVDGVELFLSVEIEGSTLHYPLGTSPDGVPVEAGEVIAVVGAGHALLPLGGEHRANVLLRFAWVPLDHSYSLRYWDQAIRFFPYLGVEASSSTTTSTTVRPADWYESCYNTIGELTDAGYAAMRQIGALTVAADDARSGTASWAAVAEVARTRIIPYLGDVIALAVEVIAADPDTVSTLAATAFQNAAEPLADQAEGLLSDVLAPDGGPVDEAAWAAWWAIWVDSVQDLNDLLSRAPQIAFNCSD